MHLLSKPAGPCDTSRFVWCPLRRPSRTVFLLARPRPRLAPLSCSISGGSPVHNSLPPQQLGTSLRRGGRTPAAPSTLVFASYGLVPDPAELDKREKVSKRLESAAKHFRRLGSLGFWGQLVCTAVSAVILAFSLVVSGTPTSTATFYAAAGGIAAGFVSVFRSFGYIRLSKRFRNTVQDVEKAPSRAEVVKKLQNSVIINVLGMGLTLLGMLATIGTLVAKALTSTPSPYLQGIPPGYSPVLALDVFLVQASANTALSHFLGLVFSLELLRSVTGRPMDNVATKPS